MTKLKSENKWVESTLVNDEFSTDNEMRRYFMEEGKMTKTKADCYVKQRDKALLHPLTFKLKKCSKK